MIKKKYPTGYVRIRNYQLYRLKIAARAQEHSVGTYIIADLYLSLPVDGRALKFEDNGKTRVCLNARECRKFSMPLSRARDTQEIVAVVTNIIPIYTPILLDVKVLVSRLF